MLHMTTLRLHYAAYDYTMYKYILAAHRGGEWLRTRHLHPITQKFGIRLHKSFNMFAYALHACRGGRRRSADKGG